MANNRKPDPGCSEAFREFQGVLQELLPGFCLEPFSWVLRSLGAFHANPLGSSLKPSMGLSESPLEFLSCLGGFHRILENELRVRFDFGIGPLENVLGGLLVGPQILCYPRIELT